MSSEGGTRSQPRARFYAFVPWSQFSQGDDGSHGDEDVQTEEGKRVVEPPCVDPRGGTSLPVRVEGRAESARDLGVLEDDADLPVLRRRPEGPVHARDEDRSTVHDNALVVEPFDRSSRLEQAGFHRKALRLRSMVDAQDDIVVRTGFGFDGRPAPVHEDAHRDAASRGVEHGFEERIRPIAPGVLDVERLDRDALAGRRQ
jgi:hypothetical protein